MVIRMDFQLLGETIALDPNRENYNAYRTMFQEKAKNAVSSFRNLYKSNTSLEMVIKNSPKQMTQCLQPAISLCVQILIDRGVLSVDEERFINLYPDILDPINEAYTKIQDQYAEIVLTEEEKDAYRTARRQNRSKWQGGGFGIDGAIKGAATASMLNAVTGAGNMVFNGLAASHRETLQEKWDNLDRKLRSADTLLKDGDSILCENIEEATELRTLLSGLKFRLDSCGTGISAEQPLLQLKSDLIEMNISSEAKEVYKKEINRRLSDIDLVARTALGKEYPTRDAAKEAQQLYSQLQSDLAAGNLREKGDLLRNRINSADFPEEKRTELLDQLFQSENAREIKVSKVIGILSYAILIAIAILSYFFYLSGTPEFVQQDVQVFGISLKLIDIEEVYSLGFIDGLKNGFVVYGRCFGDIFRNGFLEYIGGFDFGLIGNILWGILGIIWLLIKHFFLGIARYLVTLVVTLFQKASIRYYLGYIIGSAVPMAVSQFTFDDENQAENVNRIKSWTAKKIFLALVTVFLVAVVVFLFVLQEI